MANKVTSSSDMSMVDNYIKNVYNIDMNKIQAISLPIKILFEDSWHSLLN